MSDKPTKKESEAQLVNYSAEDIQEMNATLQEASKVMNMGSFAKNILENKTPTDVMAEVVGNLNRFIQYWNENYLFVHEALNAGVEIAIPEIVEPDFLTKKISTTEFKKDASYKKPDQSYHQQTLQYDIGRAIADIEGMETSGVDARTWVESLKPKMQKIQQAVSLMKGVLGESA